MTTDETVQFIRGHYEFMKCNPQSAAMDCYRKYVEGLIVMASIIGIIDYATNVILLEELTEVVYEGS